MNDAKKIYIKKKIFLAIVTISSRAASSTARQNTSSPILLHSTNQAGRITK